MDPADEGKGRFPFLLHCRPLQSCFDTSRRPSEIEAVGLTTGATR